MNELVDFRYEFNGLKVYTIKMLSLHNNFSIKSFKN